MLKDKSSSKFDKISLYFPMIFYFLFMLILLVLRSYPIYWFTGNEYYNPVYPTRGLNLIPFSTFTFYIQENKKQWLDVLGNIVLFVPMGIYIHSLSKSKKIWKSILCFITIDIAIETTQYLLATGSFDIDDIIMNTIGGIIGIFMCHAIYIFFKKDNVKLNALISMASIILIPFLILLFIQYEVWVPLIKYAIMSVFIIGVYNSILYQFYRTKDQKTKIAFWSFVVLFTLMYLFLALPEVSPNL